MFKFSPIKPRNWAGTEPVKMGQAEIIIGNLRDTFACAAMQGFLSAAGDINEDVLSTMVRGSYMVADAMMVERAKK